MFLFNIVILAVSLYTINNNYTRYNICSAWFLDVAISNCSKCNTYLEKAIIAAIYHKSKATEGLVIRLLRVLRLLTLHCIAS